MPILQAIHRNKRTIYRTCLRRDWPMCSLILVGWSGRGGGGVRLGAATARHPRLSETVVAQSTGFGAGIGGRLRWPVSDPPD